MTNLKRHPAYQKTMPASLTIDANHKSTLIFGELENCNIEIKENSETKIFVILNKGFEGKKVINFNFNGKHSKLEFFVVALGKNSEEYKFETISNHLVSETSGFYYVRTALDDRSKVDYRGNLVIKKEGQMTDSYLKHDSLMLSKTSKTDTEPCLEIEADDVKAGHAASIGNLDDELLFYLASRGMNRKVATRVLISAFLKADLSKIEDEELRSIIAEEIESWTTN